MTEQQLNSLKKMLASSVNFENSTDLDETILAASVENMADTNNQSNKLLGVIPLDSLATAAFSITLCVGALFLMSQIISISDQNQITVNNSLADRDLSIELIPEKFVDGHEVDELFTNIKPTLPPEFGERMTQDQIFANLELPNVQTLLNGKELSIADERTKVENALADINQMLRRGAINDARERYDRLRRSCSACDLPKSLEALALVKDPTKTRI